MNDIGNISSAAMLGRLNISVWEGRKKDKETEAEVQVEKNARSKHATSVHKHLFAESPALENIKALRGEARVWFNNVTLPWDDGGNRIITTKQYFEIMNDAQKLNTRFNDAVRIFISVYPTEIAKQAFELGNLFNRNEYPDASEIATKFNFALNVSPLPTAGDFRVDIGNEALEELKKRCEIDTQTRLKQAMADAWNRIRTQVELIRNRMDAVLTFKGDEVEEIKNNNTTEITIKKKRRPKVHQSLIDNGLELCGLLSDLNVTNDAQLETARKDLESALVHIDIDSLRESPEIQNATKSKMDSILSKLNF